MHGRPSERAVPNSWNAVADVDLPSDETAPSLDEFIEALARSKIGKALGVCNISAESLKDGGLAVTHGLLAVLTTVWQSGSFRPDC